MGKLNKGAKIVVFLLNPCEGAHYFRKESGCQLTEANAPPHEDFNLTRNFMGIKDIGAKKRFEIFERDNFTCQYCGRKPPEIILHLDHIHPSSKKGVDEDFNLITSCQQCNLGKGNKILINPDRKEAIEKEIENLEEAQKQIEKYCEYLTKYSQMKKQNPIIEILCKKWEELSEHKTKISERGKREIELLLKKHTPEKIMEAMEIAWGKKLDDSNKTYKK